MRVCLLSRIGFCVPRGTSRREANSAGSVERAWVTVRSDSSGDSIRSVPPPPPPLRTSLEALVGEEEEEVYNTSRGQCTGHEEASGRRDDTYGHFDTRSLVRSPSGRAN